MKKYKQFLPYGGNSSDAIIRAASYGIGHCYIGLQYRELQTMTYYVFDNRADCDEFRQSKNLNNYYRYETGFCTVGEDVRWCCQVNSYKWERESEKKNAAPVAEPEVVAAQINAFHDMEVALLTYNNASPTIKEDENTMEDTNNWDLNLIKEAVNDYSYFSNDTWDSKDTAANFAISTLEAFEDADEYAEGDLWDVASRLTEGENITGSWYCNRYKAQQEVLNNIDWFESVAEYAHEEGLVQGDKPMLNLLDIESEHVLYRIIGNEILFYALYEYFCENDSRANREKIGNDEREAFIAFYKGMGYQEEVEE